MRDDEATRISASLFVIKGGFIQPNGEAWLGDSAKNRAWDLHSCGFT